MIWINDHIVVLTPGYTEILRELSITARRNEMTEVCVNGLVFVFYDDDALMEWLDAHADEVREE